MNPEPIKVCCFVESRAEAKRKGYPSRASFLEQRVFTEATLNRLRACRAGIALAAFAEEEGLDDIVRELNRQGVATDLWLNLPFEHGYWQSKANVAAARREVFRLLNWIESARLRVRNIGIDVEPEMELAPHLINLDFLRIIPRLLRVARPKNAQAQFELMIREINATHGVDIYKLPLIGSYSLSRRLFNLHSTPPFFHEDPRNRVVSMLYSSLAPFHSSSFVERYIRSDETPAIGIISSDRHNPGVELPSAKGRARSRLLSDELIARDVMQVKKIYRARKVSPSMYVFALNGPGTLEKLEYAAAAAPRF